MKGEAPAGERARLRPECALALWSVMGWVSWPVPLSQSFSLSGSVIFPVRNFFSSPASRPLSLSDLALRPRLHQRRFYWAISLPLVSASEIRPRLHRRQEFFLLSVSAWGLASPSFSISISASPASASRSASAFPMEWAKRPRAFLRALSFSFRRSFGRGRKLQEVR